MSRMTAYDVLDQACARLDECRAKYTIHAMDAALDVNERMAMGHKAHRLREIIRRLRKDAAGFYDA